MTRLVMEFSIDNDAFAPDGAAVADTVADIAGRICRELCREGLESLILDGSRPIADPNGNTVGSYGIEA